MTKKGLDNNKNKYFVICMIVTNNNKLLKKQYSRFISSNLSDIRKVDLHNNMFYSNGKFKELKGAYLSVDLKKKFIKYFCRNHLFDIYYICVQNRYVENIFYENKARAFNYLIRLSIELNTNNLNINKDINYLYVDERNVKTSTVATLGEYLNIELVTGKKVQKSFIVEYHQSEECKLIQIADVFSNIYYSYTNGDVFNDDINYMRFNKYIKNEFNFPFIY